MSDDWAFDPMVFGDETFDVRKLPFDSAFDDVVFDADPSAGAVVEPVVKSGGGNVLRFIPNQRDEDDEIMEISVRALRMMMWRR